MSYTTGLRGLKVDTEELINAGTQLIRVGNAFDVSDNLEQIALDGIDGEGNRGEMPGVHELRRAVEDFNSKWSVRRKKVREHVSELASATTMVGENFNETEKQLAMSIDPPKAQGSGSIFGPVPDSVWSSQQ